MRPDGFWYRGSFRLVRNPQYDNKCAQRMWQPPGAGRGVWAWAIAIGDLPQFYEVYGDSAWQRLRPRRGAGAWAVHWNELDAYVCGRSDRQPTYEEFDPERHLLHAEVRACHCPCGCGRPEGAGTWFATNWAVFVEGSMVHRRTKRPRWFRETKGA